MNRGRVRGTGGEFSSSRGRSSRSGGRSSYRRGRIGADGHVSNDKFGSRDANSFSRRQTWEPKSVGSSSKNSERAFGDHIGTPLQGESSPESVGSSPVTSTSAHNEYSSLSTESGSLDTRKPQGKTNGEDVGHSFISSQEFSHKEQEIFIQGDPRRPQGKTTDEDVGHSFILSQEFSHKVNISCMQDESPQISKSNISDRPSQNDGFKSRQASPWNSSGDKKLELSEKSTVVEPFDICRTKIGTPVMLKPSLLVKNREKRNEIKRSSEGQKGRSLRSGMVILKNYLSCADQVNIVKKCRDLGMGSGGFYQPGYRDGAKLHLKMMCLGKNWDPETSQYGDHRPIDGAKPPMIPNEFSLLVKRAIEDSHVIIGREVDRSRVTEVLPSMSPNICIVNFYTASGRLGLHQDRDESLESRQKGLPVISFSIGDSAEFLYGDESDQAKAEPVVLESGDVLIFGGKSRHIYHGVSTIHSNTAPKPLLEETHLCPGRLNLTFREY